MLKWFKSLFEYTKTEYELLLDREADPNFVPPVRFEMMPDGTLVLRPYIKQPQPYRW